MRKKLMVPIIVLGFILLLSILLLSNKEMLSQSPIKKGLPINNLSAITSDSQGNLYMIVAERRTIIKMDKNGTCQYTIEPVGADKNSMYLFSDATVDQEGYLYVRRTDLDSKGMYVDAESVIRFSPQGQLDRVLHRIDYKEDNRPLRAGNIKSLQLKDDYLYFHYLQPDRDYLYSISLRDYALNRYIIAYLPANVYLADITGTKPGDIYYSTQRGEIYGINENGDSRLLYPAIINLSSWQEQTPDRTFPTQLKLYQDKLYFIDTFANEIRSITIRQTDSGSTVFSQTNLGSGGKLSVLKDMVMAADGSLTVAVRDRIYNVDVNGKLIKTITQASQPLPTMLERLLVWALPLALLGLIIYLIRYLYREVLNRRVSLVVKQIVVFTPIIIIAMVSLSWFIYQQFSDREEREVYRQLEVLTRTGLNRLDPTRLEKISSPRDYMNDDYQFLRDLTIEAQIHRGSSNDNKLDEAGLYSAIYKLENDKLYAIVDYDNSVNMYRPISIAGEFKQVLNSKQMVKDKANDENGSWMFAMAPIIDADGKIIGIYESGVDRSGFNRDRMELFKDIAINISYITLGIICIFMLVTYFQLRSLRKLRSSVAEIARGNWETAAAQDTGDEVADLGASVNDMAAYIWHNIQEITNLSEAYYRFVPQQFLSLLGKKSIIDVQLGDQVRQDMTIFHLNINSFYQLSNTMSPEDNFNFIKSYLSWMGPVIRANDGMIDKYTGPGFVALFQNQANQAVRAAIELRHKMIEYNAGRNRAGYQPIDIGIGIHKGPLMMGVIGEERRMAGTVISDNVNAASFLQLMTAKLACAIIITEEVLKAMENTHRCQYRCLGRIQYEGREEPLLLYDVFEGEAEHIRILKLESKELFEEGINLFQAGKLYEARSKFVEVIKNNRQDEIARIYFYLCEKHEKSGLPEGWDGSLVL
ncbi:MAG: adenylate/guanylate cyclase domain-containing protein [Syntrophomonas sp.]|nr:adenylate/guanylate cyclase domain-containing protein [Syntrophomonas sp.]